MIGDRHPSQRAGESARDYHDRCHTIDGGPFEACRGYPCRTFRLRGWLHERTLGLLIRARLVGLYTLPSRALEAWDGRR